METKINTRLLSISCMKKSSWYVRATAWLIMLMGCSLFCAADDFLPLVEKGQAKAFILLGRQPSRQEQFAADELKAYLRKMTGAELPVFRTGDTNLPAQPAVLIGRPPTHEVVAELAGRGEIAPDEKQLTHDGFVLKTVVWNGRPALVVAGASDVATVYAVYDLLERYGPVGFFRHEEHVPRRESFSVPACDAAERPMFRVRLQGGQYHYFGIHYFSEAQWQEELRWFAQNRMNRINYFPGPNVLYLIEAPMWKRLGIEAPPQSDPRERNPGEALAMVKRLTQYGRDLGVRAHFHATDGQISHGVAEQFRKKYPDVNYLTITRNNETGVYIHPADPMWLRLNQEIIANFAEHFGDSELLSMPSPWGERSPGKTPEEQEELTREYAAAVGRLATWAGTKYPGAEWFLDGWALANHQYWQPYRTERLLNALPKDFNLVIWDYPAEDEPSYVRNEYWFGRPWGYAAFGSMAGNATVHGDAGRLVGEVFRVLADQRAGKLVGFGRYTEALDYAPFFQDLVMHMAWDPIMNLDAFVEDYCERRYAAESVPAMRACHQKLLKTVYGPHSDTHLKDGFRTVRAQDPVYWFKLGENWAPFDEIQRRVAVARAYWPPLLRDALADALKAARAERDNPAWRRDVADIMRSYVQARMNETIWEAGQAACRGDLAAFEKADARARRLFDRLLAAIGIVADRQEYSVTALIRDFLDAPLKFDESEIRHHLYYTTFGGDRIYDYWRSDRYEMIRDIYRPLTLAYLDGCRAQLQAGKKGLPEVAARAGAYQTIMDAAPLPDDARGKLEPEMQKVVDRFINGPTEPPPAPPDAAGVAREFLKAVAHGEI